MEKYFEWLKSLDNDAISAMLSVYLQDKKEFSTSADLAEETVTNYITENLTLSETEKEHICDMITNALVHTQQEYFCDGFRCAVAFMFKPLSEIKSIAFMRSKNHGKEAIK